MHAEYAALASRSASAVKGAMYLIITLYFCAPIFAEPLAPGHTDWDQHLFFAGQVLKNVIEYGSAPFWSPWYCGGNVMWQNPQVALLSPVLLLATLVPLTLAMKLNIVFHYWLGFMGMHLLITRVIGLSFLPIVVFLATLFTACGAIVLQLQEGHSSFLPIMYMPILLLWLIRAFQSGRIRDSLLAGSMLALMVWNGGVHNIPGILLPAGALVVVAAAVTRRWRPLILGGCFVVSGFAYAAPKLLPVSLFVTGERLNDSRPHPHPDLVPLQMLPHVYLNPDAHTGLAENLKWGWVEYGNYVGTFSTIMLIVGMVGALWYRGTNDRWLGLGLAAATLLCFLLSLGEFADWAPASLTNYVPILSSFRKPSRYTMYFLLFATITLAWTLRSAGANTLTGSRVGGFIALIFLISSAHMIEVNRIHWRGAFHEAQFDTSFQWGRSPSLLTTDATSRRSGMLQALVQDRLFWNCYESLRLRRTARPDRPPVFSDGKSTLEVRRFQPNRIEFDVVNGDEPARVYLNTNWSPGWHTNAGTITVVDDGPSFVTLAQGQSGTFAFWFVPKGLWIGVLVLTAAILVSISVWRMRIGLAYARPGASNERPTFAEVVAGRAVGAMYWLRLRRDWLYLLSLGYSVAVIQRLDWRPEDSDEPIFLGALLLPITAVAIARMVRLKGVRRWVGGMFFASALLRVGIGGSLAAAAFHDPLFWGLMALVALIVSVLTGRWPVVASVASAIAGGGAMVATLLPMFSNFDSAFLQINLDVVRQSFSALSNQLGAVATAFLLGLWVHGIGGSGRPRNGIGNIAVAVRAALLTALAFCLAGAVQTSQLESSWMVALGILLGLAEDEK